MGGSKQKYTPEYLAPFVAAAFSVTDLIRKLGLPANGGNFRLITARLRGSGLDTSHFGPQTIRERVAAIPEDNLRASVAASESIASVARQFDLPADGRACHELTKRVRALGLDTSHMSGARWNKNKTAATHPSIARSARAKSIPDELVFVENSSVINHGPGLIRRLLAQGWVYKCQVCGIDEWLGEKLVLHLDHINGNSTDNRYANLRLLCPNCHSQTDTYCNRSRPTRASEPSAHYSCYTSAISRACRNW